VTILLVTRFMEQVERLRHRIAVIDAGRVVTHRPARGAARRRLGISAPSRVPEHKDPRS
jgi:ABC-type methionine transport system ATPase subunit